jgi:hypothetical protein
LLGVLLCTAGIASPRALTGLIQLLSICTTALVTPAHSSGHDKRQSDDANDDHDYDDSRPHC